MEATRHYPWRKALKFAGLEPTDIVLHKFPWGPHCNNDLSDRGGPYPFGKKARNSVSMQKL